MCEVESGKWKVESGKWKVESYGICFANELKSVGKAHTLIVNFQLSTVNYLSFHRNDKYEFDICAILGYNKATYFRKE